MLDRKLGAALLFPALLLCSQEPTLTPKSRAWLLRGLMAEKAQVRKAIPRGPEGIHIHADGQVDERNLQFLTVNRGTALNVGQVAMITKLDFKKDSIIFDINGGEKGAHHHWYDRIQVEGPIGTTSTTTDQQTEQLPGCEIVIDFGKPVPDLTVDQVKEMLAAVLDFNQRSVSLVASDSWPPEVKEAVKNHTIIAGMTHDEVTASRGKPDNKIREHPQKVDQETWVYGVPPNKVLLVVFEGDEVVEAKEYLPGIPATKVPRGDLPAPGSVPPNPPKP